MVGEGSSVYLCLSKCLEYVPGAEKSLCGGIEIIEVVTKCNNIQFAVSQRSPAVLSVGQNHRASVLAVGTLEKPQKWKGNAATANSNSQIPSSSTWVNGRSEWHLFSIKHWADWEHCRPFQAAPGSP